MSKKLTKGDLVPGMIIHSAKYPDVVAILLKRLGGEDDLWSARNLLKGNEEALTFNIEAKTIVNAGATEISRTTLGMLMYEYHVNRHLKTMEEALDKALDELEQSDNEQDPQVKQPKFKYASGRECVDVMLTAKGEDAQIKILMRDFVINNNEELEEKATELFIKSMVKRDKYLPELCDFLYANQKPL